MNPLILGPIVEAAKKVLDRVMPDPAARAAAELELLRLQQAGEFKAIDADLQLALAQTEINKIEASNANIFISGWRPAMGWMCVAIYGANYIGVPLLGWISTWAGIEPPERLNIGEVVPVLLALLGFGGLKTFETVKQKG